MIKTWLAVCEVNMDASHKVKTVVNANTKRKAEKFAIDRLYKDGYFYVKLLFCKEIKSEEDWEDLKERK